MNSTMNMRVFDVELSLSDQMECEKEAKRIICEIMPHWDVNKVKFEIYTTGITNKIFAAFEQPSDRIIFRVFGKNTEKIIDRSHEFAVWAKLADHGLASPLHAKFANGIICGYLPGTSLNVYDLKSPKIKKEICRTMANFHNIDRMLPKTPCTFRKMKDFLINIHPRFEDQEKQIIFNNYFSSSLVEQVDEIEQLVLELNEDVVFCHNDLLVHNILFDAEREKVNFIDYEYADFNFAMFDIANHFCEYAGIDNPDYSLCATNSEKSAFIYDYLEIREDRVDDRRLQQMLSRCSLFEAVSHLFWAIWAIVQAQNSTINFNYLEFAITRHRQYVKCLAEYDRNHVDT